MAGKASGRQLGIAHRPMRARIADQIAALRRVALRRVRRDHQTRSALARGVDVIGMRRRIGKASPGPRHAHDVIDESRRPREILVLGGREDPAVLVVHPGEALVAIAERQTQPPIVADPLPQPLGALIVERQLGVRQDDRLTKGAPFAIGNLDRRLARKGLVGHARIERDMRVAPRTAEAARSRGWRRAGCDDQRHSEQQPGRQNAPRQQGPPPPPRIAALGRPAPL